MLGNRLLLDLSPLLFSSLLTCEYTRNQHLNHMSGSEFIFTREVLPLNTHIYTRHSVVVLFDVPDVILIGKEIADQRDSEDRCQRIEREGGRCSEELSVMISRIPRETQEDSQNAH